MRFRSAAVASAALAALIVPGIASAETITPVRVIASSYYSVQQVPQNLINNLGLDLTRGATPLVTQAPDGNGTDMWHAGTGQGGGGNAPTVASQYLIFDLGANYALDAVDLWQFAQTNLVSRGVSSFTLQTSADTPNDTAWANPTTYTVTNLRTPTLTNASLTTAPNNTPVGPQSIALSGSTAFNVRQVRVQINAAQSNLANDYVGLSKVKFQGSLVPTVNTGTWNGSGYDVPVGSLSSSSDLYFNTNNSQTVQAANAFEARTLNVSAGNYVFAPLANGSFAVHGVNVTGGGRATLVNFAAGGLPGSTSPTPRPGYTTAANVMSVDGAGSSLSFNANTSTTPTGRVTVFGTARMNTSLRITNGGVAAFDSQTYFGDLSGSATVTVDGVGSRLNLNNDFGMISVLGRGLAPGGAEYGSGVLSVTNGATAAVGGDMVVGLLGGRGQITVGRTDGGDTAVSNFTVRILNFGNGTGTSTLRINPKGAVTAYSDLNGSQSSAVILAGGSLQTPRLISQGSFNWSSGTLTLTGGTGFASGIGSQDSTFPVPMNGLLRGSSKINNFLGVGGTVSPGQTDGETATIAARALVLSSRSVLDFDLNVATGASDLLDVQDDGTVSIISGATLKFDLVGVPAENFTPKTFLILRNDLSDAISNGGGGPGVFTNFIPSNPLAQYTIDYAFSGTDSFGRVGNGNDVAITVTAVPEPVALSALGLGATLLLRRRRANPIGARS